MKLLLMCIYFIIVNQYLKLRYESIKKFEAFNTKIENSEKV